MNLTYFIGKKYIDDKCKDLASKNYVDSALKLLYPVGSIYLSLNATNPEQLFGFGKWEPCGVGRTPLSVDVDDSSINTSGITGGNHSVTLNVNNLPEHYHHCDIIQEDTGSTTLTVNQIPSHHHGGVGYTFAGQKLISRQFANGTYANCIALTGNETTNTMQSTYTGGGQGHTHKIERASGGTGSMITGGISTPFSIMSPYFTCYMWKRVS